jgi:hypothetical protein
MGRCSQASQPRVLRGVPRSVYRGASADEKATSLLAYWRYLVRLRPCARGEVLCADPGSVTAQSSLLAANRRVAPIRDDNRSDQWTASDTALSGGASVPTCIRSIREAYRDGPSQRRSATTIRTSHRVCGGCGERLRQRALRPLEWFNLVAKQATNTRAPSAVQQEGFRPLLDARLMCLENERRTYGRSASLRGSPRRRRPARQGSAPFDPRDHGARDEGSRIGASELAKALGIGRASCTGVGNSRLIRPAAAYGCAR